MNPIVVVRLRGVHALHCKFLSLGVSQIMSSLVSYYGVPNDHTTNLFVRAPVTLLHLSFEPRGKSVLGHFAPVAIQKYMAGSDFAHLLLFPDEPE